LGWDEKNVNDLNALGFTSTLRANVQLMITKINMTCPIVFALAKNKAITPLKIKLHLRVELHLNFPCSYLTDMSNVVLLDRLIKTFK
jgi:hypothetical protein